MVCLDAGVPTVRIEYWGRIRLKSGSYYVTVPAEMIKVLRKSQADERVVNKEVRVEVTL